MGRRRNAITQARGIVASVDRDLLSTQAALQALATSHRLASDDFAGFHARALEALDKMNADSIMVLEPAGQMLLSTRAPYGTPLPLVKVPALLQSIFETGKPAVSDLLIGPLTKGLMFTIAVPVKREGSTTYALSATVAPQQLVHLLSQQGLPDSWRAVVADSSGSIVARTHEMARFAGQKVLPDLARHMDIAQEGSFETRTQVARPCWMPP